MPCYIELNDENVVVAVHDLELEYDGEATVINTGDRFLVEHFGDIYIGSMTEFTDCFEITENHIFRHRQRWILWCRRWITFRC